MSLPYYSQQASAASVEDLNDLITGRGSWGRGLRDLWLRLKCRLTGGHYMTKRRWHRKGDFKDGEWHVGCRQCPVFWIVGGNGE